MKRENKGIEERHAQETPGVSETMIPVKNSEVTVREEIKDDGKYILFDADNEIILVTNPTGKFILDNCDGEKAVGQIIKAIENDFVVSDDTDLLSVVKGFISTLLKAKLITIK